MSRYSCALGYIVLQLAVAGIGTAQEGPKSQGLPNASVAKKEEGLKRGELPNAPIRKQESTAGAKLERPTGATQETAPQKRENAFHSTVEVLGRRSVFFPDLAASRKPLRPFQKFELFADQSIAPPQNPEFPGGCRDRPGGEHPARIRTGSRRIRETIRFFDG